MNRGSRISAPWALLRALLVVLTLLGVPAGAPAVALADHGPTLSTTAPSRELRAVDELQIPARLSAPDEPVRSGLGAGAPTAIAAEAAGLAVVGYRPVGTWRPDAPRPALRRDAYPARAPPGSMDA